MMKLHAFLGVAIYASGVLSKTPFDIPSSRIHARQSGVTWEPCFKPNLECAGFPVPLDYANPSLGNARLALIRYKATATPRLGSLFFNPGGPGGSGVAMVEASGRTFSNLTGGHYDIVGWDPRGINNTLPFINCFNSQITESQMMTRIQDIQVEAGRNFSAADAQKLYGQEAYIDQTISAVYQACSVDEMDNLKYVGTAAAARDLIAMSDALEGPNSLVNYWGLSYGTVIGTYLVNMFPNRVGRIIIDGVVSPNGYSAQPPYLLLENYLTDAGKAFDGFCEACAAAGTRCIIARGRTAPQLKDYVFTLIDAVYTYFPLGYPYSSEDIRSVLYSYMYEPLAWPELADLMRQLEASLVQFQQFIGQGNTQGNTKRQTFKTDFVLHLPTTMNPVLYENLPFITKIKDQARRSPLAKRQDSTVNTWGYYAVTCGDAVDPGTTVTKNVLDEIVRVSTNVSPLFGPNFGVGGFFCHRWGSRAVERYTGPWNTQLANPILVIGNTADPITSLVNAKFVADQLGSSAVLLTVDAYGHTSLAMPSTCALSAVANYLLSGRLPAAGTTCPTDTKLFSDERPVISADAFLSTIMPLTATQAGPYTTPVRTSTNPLQTTGGQSNGFGNAASSSGRLMRAMDFQWMVSASFFISLLMLSSSL